MAIQAYQKSAPVLIDYLLLLSQEYDKMLQVRLVKGAYWDTEIKYAQEQGFSEYPVFTRKSNTDLCYLVCAQKLLRHKENFYPMFGTHNAHTVSAILSMADDPQAYEFQKLYGMGDALYAKVKEDNKDVNVSVYAPVGYYEDLLPYLVRRMLENGANSSFVNQLYDKKYSPKLLTLSLIHI